MNDDLAERVLGKLVKHHGEPVLRLSHFCEAIRTWARCIEQGVKDNPDEELQQGRAYAEHLDQMLTDIQKSGLLFRLIYQGESVRVAKCPYHHGRMDSSQWVGAMLSPPSLLCQCDGSGWVPIKGEPIEELGL